MKVNKLSIKKLYNHFNYEKIEFNDDITFLYGLNGSGKTTILNILVIILSGNLYKLFEYDFEEISLKYTIDNFNSKENEILIKKNNNHFIIFFEDKKYNLKNIYDQTEIDDYIMKAKHIEVSINSNRINNYYQENYPFLKEIQSNFKYVYLPLDRISKMNNINDEERYIYSKKGLARRVEKNETRVFDKSMKDIEELISETSYSMNNRIRRIDTQFRNEVLKSLINIKITNTQNYVLENYIGENQLKASDVKNIQEQYISILNQLELISPREESDLNKFFGQLMEDVKKLTGGKKEVSLDTILSLSEVVRIRKIVDLAKNTEEKKAKVTSQIELFLEMVNEFTNRGVDGKNIQIKNGEIYFMTRYSSKRISIHLLSSGEKQLLTFFANLIFRINKKRSIYIVDEPELSLHLSWQTIFVDRVSKIANDVQFIFATHAPEIISHRRDKMVKLSKEYVD